MAGLLSQYGVEVKEVTTDPDSAADLIGESLFKDGLQANLPTHHLDTRHLSENIRKSIKRDNKLQIMPKRTKAEKTKLLANFALDVIDRCTAEINQAHALYVVDAAKGKTSSITLNMHWYLTIWGIVICVLK